MTEKSSSTWSPLRLPLFRALWLAAVPSNVRTRMHNVGAEWLMTTLPPAPFVVAPVVAGATLAGVTTPSVLLVLTFALGLGAAMNAPAWQAIVPELVPRGELTSAVSLNSVAFNIARAVGPALGGIIVAAAGPWAVFLLNSLSFVGVIFVLYRWRRERVESISPTERVWGAMRAGLRYARHAPELKSVLVRTGVFALCASALWAMMPLVARAGLKLDAFQYGVLLGCLGAGAIAGAFALS